MALLRRIPTTPDQTYKFLREVNFTTYAAQLAALSITQRPAPLPRPALSNGENNDAPDKNINTPPSRQVNINDKLSQLRMILGSSQINNAWIFGSEGIGKSAVVEALFRARAEGRLSGHALSRPHYIFDTNQFFVLPREKWVEEFDKALELLAEREGLVVFDRMDDFINIAGGEAERLVNSLVSRLERQSGLQSIIISQIESVKAIKECSSGLVRQFQEMKMITEPTFDQMKPILLAHFRTLEKVHNVTYREEAADEMIRLMSRLPGRAFTGSRPNNMLSFADKCGSFVRINVYAEPPEIAIMREKIGLMQDELAILSEEGLPTKDRREQLTSQIKSLTEEYTQAEKEFQKKFQPLHDKRAMLEKVNLKVAAWRLKASRTSSEETQFNSDTASQKALAREADELELKLYPKLPEVTAGHVQQVFSAESRLPASTLSANQFERLERFPQYLDSEIFLQKRPKAAVAQSYTQRELGANDPSRPAGVFLLAGDTGTGKTELWKAATRFDAGVESRLDLIDTVRPIVVRLGEFKSKTSVARLTGADPGLVGYDESVKWLQELKANPKAFLLFDEANKAHPDVFDVIMQGLEEGMFVDSHGEEYPCKDAIIGIAMNGLSDADFEPDEIDNEDIIRAKLLQVETDSEEARGMKLFKPEFINRVDNVFVFTKLGPKELVQIQRKETAKVNRDYRQRGISITYDDDTAAAILDRFASSQSNGRGPRQVTSNKIRPLLTQFLMTELRKRSEAGLSTELKNERLKVEFDGNQITLGKLEGGPTTPVGIPGATVAAAARAGAPPPPV